MWRVQTHGGHVDKVQGMPVINSVDDAKGSTGSGKSRWSSGDSGMS